MLFVWLRKTFLLTKMAFFEKSASTICVREVKRHAFSLTLSVFGKWYFLWPYRITKHYEHRGCSRHRENPKWYFWLQNLPFWEGPSKGVFTICDTQKLCSAENAILKVFSAKHSFAEIKSVSWKTEIYQILGAVCQHAKRCFFLFSFGALFFFVFCWKSPQKAIFLQVWRFFLFCSPKRPVFKILLFFLFCFFLVFPLSSLSKFHHFFLLSIDPFFWTKNAFLGVSSILFLFLC